MAVNAWLSNMAFKPFPGGTRASPCQANFLCKGGSELHKVPRGSERPLCKKANWHIFSPSHGGRFFIREAVAFMQQGRCTGGSSASTVDIIQFQISRELLTGKRSYCSNECEQCLTQKYLFLSLLYVYNCGSSWNITN